jgi:hypothetical protein
VLLLAVPPALARAALDPTELLHVDMDELTRPRALIPDTLLKPEPAEATEPKPGQDPGNGRDRHRKRLRDLSRRHPQPPQLDNDRDPLRRGAVGDPARCRRVVEQAHITSAVAANPLARAAHADTGGLGRRPQRPALINNAPNELTPAAPAESRVTVQIHPGRLLGSSSCL